MNATIAIPVEGDEIFQHFGKASMFKIYTIANDTVTASEVCETDGSAHEEVALWLLTHGVNAVICGNIGPGAQGALMAAGIIALAGVSGAADEAVGKLIAGTLEALQTANCGHHGGGCGGIEYLPRRSRAAKRALAQCGHCGHGGCCH